MSEHETYLGDGAYASFDGYQIRLRAPRSEGAIGVLRALNRNVERTLTDRKEMHWGRRKLKRGQ
jgi:hypothetical protein